MSITHAIWPSSLWRRLFPPPPPVSPKIQALRDQFTSLAPPRSLAASYPRTTSALDQLAATMTRPKPLTDDDLVAFPTIVVPEDAKRPATADDEDEDEHGKRDDEPVDDEDVDEDEDDDDEDEDDDEDDFDAGDFDDDDDDDDDAGDFDDDDVDDDDDDDDDDEH